MKIAFLADSFLLDDTSRINGAQVQMYNLARAFCIRGLEVHYIFSTKGKAPPKEIMDNISIHWIQKRNTPFYWLREINQFKNVLDRIQPNIIYQRGRSHLTYVAARWAEKNNIKFVWGSNGEDSCEFYKQVNRIRASNRPVMRKLLLYPLMAMQDTFIHKGIHDADCVINQTEYQKARLWENYRKDGIVLPSYFPYSPKKQNSYKEKIVLWLANLSPIKQPEHFLEFAKHCADIKDWRFMLGGGTLDKEYYSAIFRIAKEIPNLEMIGSVPYKNSNQLFARASLFVNTSKAEGLSNAFVQAWQNGTPVISLNSDPNNWIKIHNLGVCVHGDIKAFLSQGKMLLYNHEKLKEIGVQCIKFAKSTFSSEDIIDSYIRIFKY